MAVIGAERLRVPLWQWLGIPEWRDIPECVKSWVMARGWVEYEVAKGKAEIAEKARKKQS